MNDNNIFGWDNYDDNPLDMIGVNTVAQQKNAVRSECAQGELATTQIETFASNADKYAYPQISEVIGYDAKVLVYGEGYVEPGSGPEPQPETYTVNIVMLESDTKIPGGGSLYTSSVSPESPIIVNEGEHAAFTITATQEGAGEFDHWEMSTDGETFENVPESNGQSAMTLNIDTAGTYYFKPQGHLLN